MQARPISALAQEREALHWAERDGSSRQPRACDGHAVAAPDLSARSCRVRRLADELVTFTSSHGLADHRAKAFIFRGWAVAAQGDVAPACTHCGRASTAASDRDEGGLSRSTAACWPKPSAWRSAGQGDRDAGRSAAEFERLSLAVWMPELLRVQAAIMLQADPVPPRLRVRSWRRRRSRGRQQAHMLGLRIAMTEARLDLRLGGAEGRRVASPRHLRWSGRTMAASTCWRRARCNGAAGTIWKVSTLTVDPGAHE